MDKQILSGVVAGAIVAVAVFGVYSLERSNQYAQFGGKENFLKYQELQADQVEQALAQVGGDTAAAPTEAKAQPQAVPTADAKNLSEDERAELMAGAYILGNEDADITIIEFSDPGCGFCQRHWNQKTLEQVVDQFDGKVNTTMKINANYRPPVSAGIACAGVVGGTDAFYKYAGYSMENARATAEEIAEATGLNSDEYKKCIADNGGNDFITTSVTQFRKYGLSGTPGHLVINNTTGDYEVVSGAYPVDRFVQAVNNLLN